MSQIDFPDDHGGIQKVSQIVPQNVVVGIKIGIWVQNRMKLLNNDRPTYLYTPSKEKVGVVQGPEDLKRFYTRNRLRVTERIRSVPETLLPVRGRETFTPATPSPLPSLSVSVLRSFDLNLGKVSTYVVHKQLG